MDYDFLCRDFLETSRRALGEFREAVEKVLPGEKDLADLCERIEPYSHSKSLAEDFIIGGVDGSGEFPILQQDDVFVHLSVAAGKLFRTETKRQNKLSTIPMENGNFRDYLVIRDDPQSVVENYSKFIDRLISVSLKDLVSDSDYCEMFSQFGKKLNPRDVKWGSFAMAKASQVATHAYQVLTLSELGVGIRLLKQAPKYLLLDKSMVYFLLGETPYLPELFKRYLICQALRNNTCVVALNKSHNIPNGDLIGRMAKEKRGLKDHWFLRLPSAALNEPELRFLKDKEVPPKLCVSYLFKFHTTSFPMRIDLDAAWWKKNINYDVGIERNLFEDLDFTCHDVRSYGYPYPLHSVHRTSSLTKQERKAIRDILLQNAKTEGLLRGAFLRDPEDVHMEGI